MPEAIPVTADNFIRAETDLYFRNIVKDDGFGKFHHRREPASVEHQTVIRLNRDTLYSAAVFDLEAGPVTITLPDPGKRFMSFQVFDEDEYSPLVAYGGGKHMLTREKLGTRYGCTAVRILVDPSDPKDVAEVRKLQDAIKVEQKAPGRFESPEWDLASQKTVREALLVLGTTLADSKRMFGTRDQVEPVRRLIGAAMAWGGNPEKEATYLNVTPKLNDGQTVHTVTVKDVPVDGFWSITVYNDKGYMVPNARDVYSVNNVTAKKDADGSVTVRFGGCDGNAPNCIPIVPGWNYIVRLYRPRAEILTGKWMFPAAQPVR